MATPLELLTAIKAGQVEQVSALLAAAPALANTRAEDGTPAALLAAYYQQPAIARLLIAHGAEVDLFTACAVGELDRVRALVEAAPDRVNGFAPDGFQPLGLAAFFGQVEVVHFLLGHGAQVDTPSRNPLQVRPLHSAAAGQHLAIARALLAYGADPNARQQGGFTPAHSAAQNGQRPMLDLLASHGADLTTANDQGQTPRDLALAHHHPEVAAWLSQQSAPDPV